MDLEERDGNPVNRKEKPGCLTYFFALLYLSVFSASLFVILEVYAQHGLYSKRHPLRGSNYNFSTFKKGRTLGTAHNNMIWGNIRSVQYWEDTMDIAGEDDTGLPGSKSFEQYAQQAAQEECYSGFRLEMQPGSFKGLCYHRPNPEGSPVDRYTIADGVNLLNPAQYGDYKTPTEERAALEASGKESALNRLAYYDFAGAEQYCIKCCDESTMEMDPEVGLLATTWDLLCEDKEGGQIQIAKDLHAYEKGYEFLFFDFKNTEMFNNPLDVTHEAGNVHFIKCSPDLLGLPESDKLRSMQGYHLKLWVEYDNHFLQQLKSVVKCEVYPIWEVQLPGNPCRQNDQTGCLYNEKITMYRVKKMTWATWLIWLPVSLMVCGYCMSCIVGYAGGWCFHWCDRSSGVSWCPKNMPR